MQKIIAVLIAVSGWFALVFRIRVGLDQFDGSIVETLIHSSNFFTVLTNTLVTIYFTYLLLTWNNQKGKRVRESGLLTSLVVYITIVALVFNILLRSDWTPQGMHRVVSEIYHAFIPMAMILFWFLYDSKKPLPWKKILPWMLYPLGYIVYVLCKGQLTDFYPYPFLDASTLGWPQVGINCIGLTFLFVTVSAFYIGLGSLLYRRNLA